MSTALRWRPVSVPARVRIGPARPADVPVVETLQQRVVREVATAAPAGSAVESWIRHLVAATRAPIADGTYFLATVGGAPAGCGGWSFRRPLDERGPDDRPLDPATEPAWIHPVFVEPHLARRGVGAALLAAAERAAGRAGYWRVALHATRASEPLHRRAGYRPVDSLEVVLPGGWRVPLVRMEKPLWPAGLPRSSAATPSSTAGPAGSSS